MNKLDHILKEQLDQTAPDHLEELLSGLPPEEAPLAGAKRKSFFRTPAFRAVAAPLLAAAVVAVVLLCDPGRLLLPEANPSSISGEPVSGDVPNSPESRAEGGMASEVYPIASITCTADPPLPDGVEYPVYSYRGDEARGRGLLDLLSREFDIPFDTTLDLSDYDCRPGQSDSDIILWGNLDAGMFYYQHIIDYPASDVPDAPDLPLVTSTRAAELVQALEPYLGKLELKNTDQENYFHFTYYYAYPDAEQIDGLPTEGGFYIRFDTHGEVEAMRSDLSPCPRYVHHTSSFGEDLLEQVKSQLDGQAVPEATVEVYDWYVGYVQTVGLNGYAEACPILHVLYTVNHMGKSDTVLLIRDM